VRIRSNVVLDPDSWDLVPGEVVATYRRGHFNLPNRPPRRQHDERMYYVPCGECGRLIVEINLYGCERPYCRPTPERARENRQKHDEILKSVAEERERLGRPVAGNWRSSVAPE
jgi:hypothetical protein